MSCYGKVKYWNERYSFKNEQYEWFQSYDGFSHLLTPQTLSPPDGVHSSKARRTIEVRDRDGNLVPRSVLCPVESPRPAYSFAPKSECRVLIVGCGNSRLGEQMMLDGWTGGIANVDFSPVVIEQNTERYDEDFYKKKTYKNAMSNSTCTKVAPPMEFYCADVTDKLPFGDASFDLVLCKGTMDAILCSDGSVAQVKRMMHECCRVLDTHGAFCVISHASIDNRLVFFENEGDEWWAGIGVHSFAKKNAKDPRDEASLYICRKREGGGELTRPTPCSTADSVLSDTESSLTRSCSDEENDSTLAPEEHSKLSVPRTITGTLTQVQV